MRRIALLTLLFLLVAVRSGLAEGPPPGADKGDGKGSLEDLANPFSDYTPPPEEADVADEEHFIYFGNHYGISVGSGIQWFDGNIGRLYNAAGAQDLLFLNFWWMFNFRLWGEVSYTQMKHRFDVPGITGQTEVNMQRYEFDLKYYFNPKDFSAAITAAHPYIIGGIGRISRFQVFTDFDTVEWDNPLVLSGGGGVEFDIQPHKTRINFEAKMHFLRFKEADDQTFAPIGIPDLHGNMYSMTTSFIWMF